MLCRLQGDGRSWQGYSYRHPAEESTRRARRHEVEISSKKFSGNLEEFEKYQTEKIAKKMRTLRRKLNEDEFSLVNENEVRCVGGKDSILVSPIFHWTEHDVWAFLNTLGIKHCELYDMGYHRIGCILCPMSSMKQKQREIHDFPYVKRGWIKAIMAIRRGGVFAKEYLWWNIPKQGQMQYSGGLLRNWERSTATTTGEDGPFGGGKTSHGDLGGFSVCPSLTADRGGRRHPRKNRRLQRISSIGGYREKAIINGMQRNFCRPR